MQDYPDAQKSEFNMAVSYLSRLNSLFYICDDASMSLDANAWFHGCMALYRELSTELKPEELTEVEHLADKINTKIQRKNAYGQLPANYIPSDLYKELHTLEVTLRRVCERAGLQKKMIDDARKALR